MNSTRRPSSGRPPRRSRVDADRLLVRALELDRRVVQVGADPEHAGGLQLGRDLRAQVVGGVLLLLGAARGQQERPRRHSRSATADLTRYEGGSLHGEAPPVGEGGARTTEPSAGLRRTGGTAFTWRADGPGRWPELGSCHPALPDRVSGVSESVSGDPDQNSDRQVATGLGRAEPEVEDADSGFEAPAPLRVWCSLLRVCVHDRRCRCRAPDLPNSGVVNCP